MCLHLTRHFLHADESHFYEAPHQGSAKEVPLHEARLLPSTSNGKGLQCCKGILLHICLAKRTFCPVTAYQHALMLT